MAHLGVSRYHCTYMVLESKYKNTDHLVLHLDLHSLDNIEGRYWGGGDAIQEKGGSRIHMNSKFTYTQCACDVISMHIDET